MSLAHTVVLAAALLAVGCGSRDGRAFSPPKQVEGGWTLSSATEIAVNDAPFRADLIPVKVWLSKYQGPHDINTRFFSFSGDTLAFEAMQTWQRSPEELAFHTGNVVAVIDTRSVPKQAAGDFAEGLRRALF